MQLMDLPKGIDGSIDKTRIWASWFQRGFLGAEGWELLGADDTLLNVEGVIDCFAPRKRNALPRKRTVGPHA